MSLRIRNLSCLLSISALGTKYSDPRISTPVPHPDHQPSTTVTISAQAQTRRGRCQVSSATYVRAYVTLVSSVTLFGLFIVLYWLLRGCVSEGSGCKLPRHLITATPPSETSSRSADSLTFLDFYDAWHLSLAVQHVIVALCAETDGETGSAG